jgi:aspartyl-tRNA(Asn)/glutamyl-tRNA(Gln) amidotransferase subunit A
LERFTSLKTIQSEIEAGNVTCTELVKGYLSNIESNQDLGAFLEVYGDEALEHAASIDQKIKDGTAGRLHGLVISVKDVICHKDHEASASSQILKGFVSLYSATAVERLLEEDAIVIGRTNCDEFAMGTTNENSSNGVVRNAANKEMVPGGSSGGAAVSVQANMCLLALGTDTGGSVRQPAAFCGVVGMKPTYGRVSRHGLIAYASSFDQIGVFSQSVEDAALAMEIMSGADDFDATCSTKPVPSMSDIKPVAEKLTIAWPKIVMEMDGVDQEIRDRFQESMDQLEQEGHTLVPFDLDLLEYLVPTYYVLTTAEASSNLARYDGVHYGYQTDEAENMDDITVGSRTEAFGQEVKRRIMLGTFVLSEGYYDAYYSKAQKVRRMIGDYTNKILETADVILMPTTPTTAFPLGDKVGDPVAMYLQDIFTVQANLAGIPGISIPVKAHSNGLPIGMQLMVGKYEEEKLFQIANYFEQLTTNG